MLVHLGKRTAANQRNKNTYNPKDNTIYSFAYREAGLIFLDACITEKFLVNFC